VDAKVVRGAPVDGDTAGVRSADRRVLAKLLRGGHRLPPAAGTCPRRSSESLSRSGASRAVDFNPGGGRISRLTRSMSAFWSETERPRVGNRVARAGSSRDPAGSRASRRPRRSGRPRRRSGRSGGRFFIARRNPDFRKGWSDPEATSFPRGTRGSNARSSPATPASRNVQRPVLPLPVDRHEPASHIDQPRNGNVKEFALGEESGPPAGRRRRGAGCRRATRGWT